MCIAHVHVQVCGEVVDARAFLPDIVRRALGVRIAAAAARAAGRADVHGRSRGAGCLALHGVRRARHEDQPHRAHPRRHQEDHHASPALRLRHLAGSALQVVQGKYSSLCNRISCLLSVLKF